jgi:transcriptional regulator NrdR family protein
MVTDSRQTAAKTVRRRRECVLCKGRFTTYELKLADYNIFLKDLKNLWLQAGDLVRERGSERETR